MEMVNILIPGDTVRNDSAVVFFNVGRWGAYEEDVDGIRICHAIDIRLTGRTRDGLDMTWTRCSFRHIGEL